MGTDIYKVYTRGRGVGEFMQTLFVRTGRVYLKRQPEQRVPMELSNRQAEERTSRQTALLIESCLDWLQKRPFWGPVSLQISGGISSTYSIRFAGDRPPRPTVSYERMDAFGNMQYVLRGLERWIVADNRPPDIEITGTRVQLRNMARDAAGDPIDAVVDLARRRSRGLETIMQLVIEECIRRQIIKFPEDMKPEDLRNIRSSKKNRALTKA